MYLHTKYKVSRSRLPKVRSRTGQTDTESQKHIHDQKYYYGTFMSGKDV